MTPGWMFQLGSEGQQDHLEVIEHLIWNWDNHMAPEARGLQATSPMNGLIQGVLQLNRVVDAQRADWSSILNDAKKRSDVTQGLKPGVVAEFGLNHLPKASDTC